MKKDGGQEEQVRNQVEKHKPEPDFFSLGLAEGVRKRGEHVPCSG
jgi:hypothetical protein